MRLITIPAAVFVVVLIILAAVILAPKRGSVTERTVAAPTLLGSCQTATCDTGLACDPVTLTCKRPTGSSCGGYNDCLVGDFCSGVCVTGTTNGQVKSPCPCSCAGCVCSETGGSAALLCLLGAKAPCTSNDQCSSQVCSSGVCSPGKANGTRCVTNSDCVSGFCAVNKVCGPKL